MTSAFSDKEILEKLKEGLNSGNFLNDGRVLPERRLAEILDIGRTRLRRALDILETNGEIFRHRGQGTFAAPPPAAETGKLEVLARNVTPQNLMEVRLEIEPALAALAATRATRAEIVTLERLTEATFQAPNQQSYDKADDKFHFAIAKLAHNPLFLMIYQSVRTVRQHAAWTSRRKKSHSPERIEQLSTQHRALFHHISNRDTNAAALQMEQHLVTVSNVMLRERATFVDPGGKND